eukprot:GDKI01045937.1.p2 GENE.GDKI01045937.1~~GDKI01045937.1.p2  ORF type:complete len:201 (+),score=30.02 GDKI01045937.1:1-603(+)
MKETWEGMIEYLGFQQPSLPVDLAALGRFSTQYSHNRFAISNRGTLAVCRGRLSEYGWMCAVGEGSVGKGEIHTWKMRMVGNVPGLSASVGFGFMECGEARALSPDEQFDDEPWAGFLWDGQCKQAGDWLLWISTKSFGKELDVGDEFELCLDTRDEDAPTAQVVSHSKYKLLLPKEWERIRLVIQVDTEDDGIEILSVD